MEKLIEGIIQFNKETLGAFVILSIAGSNFFFKVCKVFKKLYLEEKNNINIVRVNIKYARAVREINHIPSKNIINGKQTVEIPSFS